MDGREAWSSLLEEKVHKEEVARVLQKLPPEHYASFCAAASPMLGLPDREVIEDAIEEEGSSRWSKNPLYFPLSLAVGFTAGLFLGTVSGFYLNPLNDPHYQNVLQGIGMLGGGTVALVVPTALDFRRALLNRKYLEDKCSQRFQEEVQEYIGKYA